MLILLTLLTLIGLQQPALAQQGGQATVSQQPPLRKFLTQELGAPESEQDSTRFLSATVDLNDDGRPESIVYLIGPDWCGSGGCTMYILHNENGRYKVVTKTTITQLPIRLLPTKTNGWHDLAVSVSGGGIRLGYEAKLSYNGKKYPSNPTVLPAKRLHPRTPGITLIPARAEASALPVYP